VQEEDGSWKKYAFMNEKRVYDSYVDHPLLMVWKHTGKERHRQAAIRNLDWITGQKQKANGWFADCDNTVKNNDRPILHTISYTIDGLIQSGILLNEQKYIDAGRKAADHLLDIFSKQGWLQGRWDENWNGSEYVICTGCAQISIVWLTLYGLTGERKYKDAASRMNDQLIFIQRRNYNEKESSKGAVTGSYPLWGKYEPFGFPNWATKYFADALMLEISSGVKK
jgi:rhamnogalacturonyl hydrolase YesR